MLSQTKNTIISTLATLKKEHLLSVLILLAFAAGAFSILLSPLKVLIFFAFFIFMFAAFLRPSWIIVFLAVFIPFEPFLLKFVPDEIYVYARYFSEGLVYVLAAVAIARIFSGRARAAATPIDWPFALFLLVAASSLVVNFVPPSVGILGLRQIIRFILLFFAVTYLAPSRCLAQTVVKICFGLIIFETILGITQAVIGAPLDEFLLPSERKFYESIQLTTGTSEFWEPGTRIFGTMGRYDQLGTFLTLFLLLAAGIFFESKRLKERQFLAFLIPFGLSALALTFSRASWFGFLLGFFAVGVLIKKNKRVLAGYLIAASIIAAYLIFSGITVRYLVEAPRQTLAERFFEAFSYERWRGEYYGLGRLFWIAQTPLVVVRHAPIFGVGPGQFGGGAAAALERSEIYDRLGLPFGVFGTEGYIDNNWFSLWGETGTLGLILYIIMFAVLGRFAFKLNKTSNDPWLKGLSLGYVGALLAVSFQAFLGTYLEMRTLAFYFWLVGAFLVALGRVKRKA